MNQKLIGGVLAAVAVIGIAVWATMSSPPTPLEESAPTTIAYQNTEFGFAFDYPTSREAKSREPDVQDSSFLDLDAKFFLSLRDTTREEKPVTVARVYSIESVSLEQYTIALEASDPGNITVKETSDLTQGGLAMKKIVNTTAIGIDKTQYLFWKDSTLVVIEVILQEEPAFDPVFATLRVL